MISQTVIWTVLPDPTVTPSADGSSQLSLLATPRLTEDQADPGTPGLSLAQFPDISQWPSLRLSVAIEIDGAAGSTTVPAEVLDPPPDADAWHALFPPERSVTSFVFNRSHAEHEFISYPSKSLTESLSTQYATLFGTPAVSGPRGARQPAMGTD